jgi:hypothetical protein
MGGILFNPVLQPSLIKAEASKPGWARLLQLQWHMLAPRIDGLDFVARRTALTTGLLRSSI